MKKYTLLVLVSLFLVTPAFAVTTSNSSSAGNANGSTNVIAQSQTRGSNLGYTPLEPIPGITSGANGQALDFPTLLGNIYKIAITIGALFSVLMLTLSGIRYMVSDVVTDKDKAKKRIRACLFGLVLIAASYLILNTINPQLVTFTLTPGTVTINGGSAQPVTSSSGAPAANSINNSADCNASGGTWNQSSSGGGAGYCTGGSGQTPAQQDCSAASGIWSSDIRGAYCYLPAATTQAECAKIPEASWRAGWFSGAYCYK